MLSFMLNIKWRLYQVDVKMFCADYIAAFIHHGFINIGLMHYNKSQPYLAVGGVEGG